jgi:hypothetical protein
MANRYSVVARTYVGWPLAGALIAVLVPACLAAAGVQSAVANVLACNFLTLGFFAWSLGTHVKEQFANPRASLFPDFRRPHLAVAVAVAMAVLVLATGTICRTSGTALLGTAAVVLIIFTSVLWWAYWPTWNWLWPTLLTLPLAFPLRQSCFTALAQGQAAVVSALLLLVCVALLATLLARLMRLDEELPEYHVPLLTRLSSQRQADVRRTWTTWGPADGQPDFLTRRLPADQGGSGRFPGVQAAEPQPSTAGEQPAGQPDFFPRRLPVDTGGSLWGRVRLWCFGMSHLSQGAVLAMGLPLAFLGLYFTASNAQMTISSLIEFPFYYGFLMSVGAPVLWVQRWPRLGYELLRPTTRRDFCRQMGLAFARESFEEWLWLLLGLGCLAAIWFPALLRTWDLAVYLALLVCMWLGQWAAMAWAVSYTRSLFLLVPATFAVSSVPLRMWTRYQTGALPFMTEYYLQLALGMMLLWIVVLFLAYRRWQQLDLP